MSKVKVIELVGAKLDPNANYLFVFNEQTVRMSDVTNLLQNGQGIIPEKSMFMRCMGDPALAVKVFEIPKSSAVAEEQPTPEDIV